jgi:hypothetical protein
MKRRRMYLIVLILLVAGLAPLSQALQGKLVYAQDGERIYLPLILVEQPTVTPSPTTPSPTSTATAAPEENWSGVVRVGRQGRGTRHQSIHV